MSRIGEDAEAFESFYREHVDAVLRYATRRTDDPHDTADLVAAVYLATIHSAGSYRAELGSPIGWLYGIARNPAAAERRRAARARDAETRISGHRLLDQDDIALRGSITRVWPRPARLRRTVSEPRGGVVLIDQAAEDWAASDAGRGKRDDIRRVGRGTQGQGTVSPVRVVMLDILLSLL